MDLQPGIGHGLFLLINTNPQLIELPAERFGIRVLWNTVHIASLHSYGLPPY